MFTTDTIGKLRSEDSSRRHYIIHTYQDTYIEYITVHMYKCMDVDKNYVSSNESSGMFKSRSVIRSR